MSKSDPADGSRINLLDSPSEIAKKIKRCKTDGFEGLEYGNPERPECSNLLGIYEVVTGKSKQVSRNPRQLASHTIRGWGRPSFKFGQVAVQALRLLPKFPCILCD